MTLQELKYLVALADLGHFGRAAAACFITPSTLSTQIKKLEDFLGVILFDRSLKHVALTPIGREILPIARHVVAQAEDIRKRCKQAHGPVIQTLRLGAIPTLAPYYLPHALNLVHGQCPNLRLLLREELTSQILENLSTGKLDAGLLATPVTDEQLQVVSLFQESFYVALPAGHRLGARNTLTVLDILNENLLLLDEGHCLRDQLLEICGQHSIEREEVRATSLETLRQMVCMGIGITLLPALAVPDQSGARYNSLEIRPFTKPGPGRTISLVWRRRAPTSEIFNQLAAILQANVPQGVEVI